MLAQRELGDFGTAKPISESILEEYRGPAGDKTYTSPELFCGMHIDPTILFGADFYSLGAILFEMFAEANLNLLIYGSLSEMDSLCRYFSVTNTSERRKIFHDFLPSMGVDLPDISVFNKKVPKSIQSQLNSLYKSLAMWDYRKRCSDFSVVFRSIEMMKIILMNEEKYERWTKLKELRRLKSERKNPSRGNNNAK